MLGIPDRAARARTLTAYLDLPATAAALGLPGTDRIGALLVDRAGVVRWRAAGPVDPAAVTALTAAVAAPAG